MQVYQHWLEGVVSCRASSFSVCDRVTDAGVSALGAGCGQLQSIKLSGCREVTDAGVSALGAGCGQLRASSFSDVMR